MENGRYWKYDEDKSGQRTYKKKNKRTKINKNNKRRTKKKVSPITLKTVKNASKNSTVPTEKDLILPTNQLSKEDMKCRSHTKDKLDVATALTSLPNQDSVEVSGKMVCFIKIAKFKLL